MELMTHSGLINLVQWRKLSRDINKTLLSIHFPLNITKKKKVIKELKNYIVNIEDIISRITDIIDIAEELMEENILKD